MAGKRLNAKHKIDRRLGCNLWGRSKSPYNIRQTGPGQHGANRGKPTDYGLQLRAKQKLKGYYGSIGEKKFRAYYFEAIRLRGDASQNLIGLLESRLDAVCYRAKFAPTVFASRQLVSHGHIKVNGKRVNIPSFQVQEGDIVEVREKSRQIAFVIAARDLAERDVPEYLSEDGEGYKITFVRRPKLEDVPYPVQMEPNLVIEFYSR
ncbi:MAG: 30S ribosomal protein S4 [Alphaproteobacteria bacterium]|nr:30S ribosomal protein S4 [Alphaproteobacteria bacterium]